MSKLKLSQNLQLTKLTCIHVKSQNMLQSTPQVDQQYPLNIKTILLDNNLNLLSNSSSKTRPSLEILIPKLSTIFYALSIHSDVTKIVRIFSIYLYSV